MKWAWLVGVALGACVASESGNSSPRCDDANRCDDGLACYRGFCIEDGTSSVDPVGGDDAAALSGRDAASDAELDARVAAEVVDSALPEHDAASADVDAATPRDAAVRDAAVMKDAAVKDAAVKDAAVKDAAVKDAAIKDAGKRPDAGTLCLDVCKPPKANEGMCKKCVEMAFGEEPEDLCGKPNDSGKDGDQALAAQVTQDPFCVSLCLGAASMDPSCGGPL